MGRLFWKFFLFLWLAQVITSTGVGIAIWFSHAARNLEGPPGTSLSQPHPQGAPPRWDEHAAGHHPDHPHPMFPPPLAPILTGGIVSLLFAGLLAWYFAGPIRSLRGAFEAVAGGRLDTRLAGIMADRRDELADLGKDFDHMAGRLQNLIAAQRRLLHDVSHELRSPLARLQAAADLMRQQPERSADFAEHIQRDTARMDRLVKDLLTLARIDAGMASPMSERVDLHEIIDAIVDDARIEAEAKACTIQFASDETTSMPVEGNPDLLASAIENVVRNAVRHAPAASGIVDIGLSVQERMLRIEVSDNGPGIRVEDLDRIFEPFVRSGVRRIDDGFGLGLAITHRIIEAHRGRVLARNRLAGGLLLAIELPAARTTV